MLQYCTWSLSFPNPDALVHLATNRRQRRGKRKANQVLPDVMRIVAGAAPSAPSAAVARSLVAGRGWNMENKQRKEGGRRTVTFLDRQTLERRLQHQAGHLPTSFFCIGILDQMCTFRLCKYRQGKAHPSLAELIIVVCE